MTAANAYLNQQGSEKARDPRQEPSMEDILASIRRIIADDQVNGQRNGYAPRRDSPAPQPNPVAAREAAAEPETDEAEPVPGQESFRGHEPAARGREDILDLARIRGLIASERGAAQAPHGGSEQDILDAQRASYPAEPDDYAEAVDVASLGDGPSGRAPPSYATVDHAAEPADTHVDFAPHPSFGSAADPHVRREPLISAQPSSSVMSAFETLAATVILQNGEMLERIMQEQLRPLIKTWLDDNLPVMVERLVRAEIERVARGGRA